MNPAESLANSLPKDANGFPTFPLPVGAQQIYVGPDGSDVNNGLSPTTARKTYKSAKTLLRAGTPDRLLFKRSFEHGSQTTFIGDTFADDSFALPGINGASASAPLMFGAYGIGPDPVFSVGLNGFKNRSNWAFADIDFYCAKHDPGSPVYDKNYIPPHAFRWIIGDGSNLILSNVRARYFSMGFNFDCGATDPVTKQQTTSFKNILYLGCKSAFNYRLDTGHSQGVYLNGVDGFYSDDRSIQHANGYNYAAGRKPDPFNHGGYYQHPQHDALGKLIDGRTCRDVLIDGGLHSLNSSHGIQGRPGITVRAALVYRNAYAGFLDGANPSSWTGGVVEQGPIIDAADPQMRHGGGGVEVLNATGGAVVQGVLFLSSALGGFGPALAFKPPSNQPWDPNARATITQNLIDKRWSGNPLVFVDPNAPPHVVDGNLVLDPVTVTQPTWCLDTYAKLCGVADANAWIARAIDNGPGNFDPRFTPSAAVKWIVAGWQPKPKTKKLISASAVYDNGTSLTKAPDADGSILFPATLPI